MPKARLHILRCLLFSAFWYLPFAGNAQDDTSVTKVEVDTTYQTVPDTAVALEEGSKDIGKYFVSVEDESYRRDSLVVRRVPDSVTRQLKKDGDFWYADKDFRKKEVIKNEDNKNRYTPLLERTWFRTILWLIVIGGFLAFIIWYLAGNEFGLFRKKPHATGDESGQEEEMPENIFEINYNRELEKAVAKGDFRLGVRLMYLQLLKRMSEKNVISYKQDKTNSDYLFTLLSSKYYDGFFRLTRNYEYTWYGHFDVPEEHFSQIRREFEQYHKLYL